MSLHALLLFSVLFSIAAYPISRLVGRYAGWVLALGPAALFVSFLPFAPELRADFAVTQTVQWAPALGVDLVFRVDGFSFLFLLLITGVGMLVTIYSGAYLTEKSPADRARFFTLILLFMTAMLGAVLSDNLIVMFMFWEATSVLSFLLIGFDGRSPHARQSALQSLQVTAGGGLALLAAIIMIGIALDTFSMAEVVQRRNELANTVFIWPIMIGILIGAFTKSAQFPFHVWLPNAMQAPTPASAFLHSATMVKLGIYLLARFDLAFSEVPGFGGILIAVGSITMLIAALKALRAEGFKAALAYSTIASLGILVMLIGLDGPRAAVAVVGFILAHALYKAALFFCAGSVIHATGVSSLRALGGLARHLPLTALAAVLASLSMAGLPPFIGFISKELLFEAQIESSWDAIPVAIAVLVNAVMVAVAAVVSLRPFFLGPKMETEFRHGETPGLLIGPLTLAFAGLWLSLEPDWVSSTVLQPAVAVLYGAPVDVHLDLWHGVTPMLLLSMVVVAVGAAIAWFWRPIHAGLNRFKALDIYSADNGYELGMRAIKLSTEATARVVQHGDLRIYLLTITAGIAVFAGIGLFAAGGAPVLAGTGGFNPVTALISLLAMVGALVAARARGLITALVAVGLVGLSVALIFLMNGAPDLALTQFSVEALIVVLLTAVFLALPLVTPPARSQGERRMDALVSVAVGLVLFIAVVDMAAGPADTRVSDFFGAESYVAAFGQNVVNVILVDFRAIDTLGETAVIATAAVMVWSLLAPRRSEVPERAERDTAFILAAMSNLFFFMLIAASVVILLRGHNQPGGGFVGGLCGALAFAVLALARGPRAAERRLRFHPLAVVGFGLALAVLSGVPGLLVHGSYLTHLWLELPLAGLDLKTGTSLIFDVGVYAVVLGGVSGFLFVLQREGAR